MMRSVRVWTLIAFALIMGGRLWADGVFVPPIDAQGENRVASTEQKGVIIGLSDGDEVLLLQTTYHGPAGEFAWIIPVPGEPGADDVFLASQDFIDETLFATKPLIVTDITGDGERHDLAEDAGMIMPPSDMAGGMGGEGGPPPTVTVHRRMEVGDFDVSVLSATGTRVLLDWLDRNGYRTPEGHEEVFGSYVERGWYFVALRILPGVAEDRPTLTEVSPVGIRFVTDELVYPLLISKLSSRPLTAMTLVVMADEAMSCLEMDAEPPDLDKRYRKGSCWASIRREMAEDSADLVHEYSGTGDLMWTDLWFRADQWRPADAPAFHKMHMDRFWGLLTLDEMQDMTFAPDAEPEDFRLRIERHGTVARTMTRRIGDQWQLLQRQGGYGSMLFRWRHGGVPLGLMATIFGFLAFGAALVMALAQRRGAQLTAWHILGDALVACILLACMTSATPMMAGVVALALVAWAIRLFRQIAADNAADDGERPSEIEALQWAVVMGGFLALLLVFLMPLSVFRWTIGAAEWVRLLTWHGSLLYVLPCLGWCTLAVHGVLSHMRAAPASARGPFFVVWALGALASVGLVLAGPMTAGLGMLRDVGAAYVFSVVGVLTLAAMAAVVAFMFVGGFAGDKARARAQLVAQTWLATVMLAIVIAFGGALAHAGTGGYIGSGHSALDNALSKLDEALTAFAEDTGCYPATLADLTRGAAPGEGLDSSGNVVPMGDGFAGPYLDELPLDPLTASADTWLYEATGSPMIDSGGFTIRLERSKPGLLAGSDYVHTLRPYYGELMGYPLEQKTLRPDAAMQSAVVRQTYNRMLVQANPSQGWVHVSATPEHARQRLALSADRLSLFCAEQSFAAERQPSVMAVDGSTQPRPLTPGPWRASIHGVSPHPRGRGWVVVAREMSPREARAMSMGASAEGLAQTHAFVLDDEHMPRKVEGSEGAVAARFTPNGEDVLVMVESPRLYGPVSEVELKRVSPNGDAQELGKALLTSDHQSFVANAWGAAWVKTDGTIVFEDPHGGGHHLEPPVPGWKPANIWVGPGVVVAAYGQATQGSARNHRYWTWAGNQATMALFDLATGASEVIGQATWFSEGASMSTIVGYDPTVPAVVNYRASGSGRHDLPGTVWIIQERDGVWLPPVPLATR